MDTSANVSAKNKITKKQIALIATLSISALVALVTVILMDFTSLGIPKIKQLTGQRLIDARIYYSGAYLSEYLSSFNAEAMKTLLTVHYIDYVFMISVCVFEVALILLLSKKNYKIMFISVFAFLELLFDLSENFLVNFVVRKFPENSSFSLGLCGGMTLFKWIFTIAYLISAVAVLGYFVAKKVKDKNGKTNGKNENQEQVDCANSHTESEISSENETTEN